MILREDKWLRGRNGPRLACCGGMAAADLGDSEERGGVVGGGDQELAPAEVVSRDSGRVCTVFLTAESTW